MSKKKQTYESAIKELQQIVNEMQEEMISIDEITEKVKRAKELMDFCKNKLREVVGNVDSLFEDQ